MRKVVILAAGTGRRLGPLSNEVPKALLPVGGKPLLEYQVRSFEKGGISPQSIIVVTGHLHNLVQEVASRLKVRTLFNPLYQETNSIVSLYHFAQMEGTDGLEEIIIVHGDLWAHPNIFEYLIQACPHNGVVVDTTAEPDGEAMKVSLQNGLIKRFGKDLGRDSSHGEYIGLGKLKGDGLCRLFSSLTGMVRRGMVNEWYDSALNEIASSIELHALDTRGLPWIEIDTREDYSEAQSLFRTVSG